MIIGINAITISDTFHWIYNPIVKHAINDAKPSITRDLNSKQSSLT